MQGKVPEETDGQLQKQVLLEILQPSVQYQDV